MGCGFVTEAGQKRGQKGRGSHGGKQTQPRADRAVGACRTAHARPGAAPMGCGPSSAVDPTVQYQLMRAAQAEGLFCESATAHAMVKQNPGLSPETLLEMLRDDLRPRRPVPVGRDPRTLSQSERLAAAATLSSVRAHKEQPPPVPFAHLDEVTPSMLPCEIPDTLRDVAEESICVICAS